MRSCLVVRHSRYEYEALHHKTDVCVRWSRRGSRCFREHPGLFTEVCSMYVYWPVCNTARGLIHPSFIYIQMGKWKIWQQFIETWKQYVRWKHSLYILKELKSQRNCMAAFFFSTAWMLKSDAFQIGLHCRSKSNGTFLRSYFQSF